MSGMGAAALRDHPIRTFVSLYRWYRPNLRGLGRRMAGVCLIASLALIGQAVLPLMAGELLEQGVWQPLRTAGLVAVVAVIVMLVYVTSLGANAIAQASAHNLRLRVFEALLESRALRQEGLARSSVVSRHTTDVDRVAEAVDLSIDSGLPGLVRTVQSLVLLTIIDWRAGAVMLAAVMAFLLIHHIVGGRMLDLDRARMDASSRVGELVDESISTSGRIAGMNLGPWQQARFAASVERLRHSSLNQGRPVALLLAGAIATGVIGLVGIVIFATIVGGSEVPVVAAALLYVQAIATGLAALPPWMRSLHLAVVSRRRIDQILTDPGRVDRSGTGPPAEPRQGLELVDLRAELAPAVALAGDTLRLPAGVVGLVTPSAPATTSLLELLGGDANPDAGAVLLDGADVRMPGAHGRICLIGDESAGFNVTLLDALRGADPACGTHEASALLELVGLEHLLYDTHGEPIGLHRPLGPGGLLLTVDERQRLMLGAALAARPDVLLVGPLQLLHNVDAMPRALGAMRSAARHCVVSVVGREMAELVDQVVFVGRGGIAVGSHVRLLADNSEYAALWSQGRQESVVDLGLLGLSADTTADLQRRLTTEHYAAGETLYREGSPADKVFFIVSGAVELSSAGPDGVPRRLAVLGAGNHCGDLRLSPDERRAETARTLAETVVRTLTRADVSAGIAGVLDLPLTQRRVIRMLLRNGPSGRTELAEHLPELAPEALAAALAELAGAGRIIEGEGLWSPVHMRRRRPRTGSVLDRLGDFGR